MNIVDLYVQNLTKDGVNNIALKNDIKLSSDELDFTYNYIKNNYKDALRNKNNFNLEDYKKKFSEENFDKLNSLLKKYINYL
jgi:lysyl-tRNA synthetase class II